MPGAMTHHYILYRAFEKYRSTVDGVTFLGIPNFWSMYDSLLSCGKKYNGYEEFKKAEVGGADNPIILPSFAYLGCWGPDLFYVGNSDVSAKWEFLADLGHWNKTAPFMRDFLKSIKPIRKTQPDNFFAKNHLAFIAGYLSHIAADIVVHPYVNSIVRNYASNRKLFSVPRSIISNLLRQIKPVGKFHTVLEDYQDAYVLYKKFYEDLGYNCIETITMYDPDFGTPTETYEKRHKEWRNINFSHAAANFILKDPAKNFFMIKRMEECYKFDEDTEGDDAEEKETKNYTFITNDRFLINIQNYFESRLPSESAVDAGHFLVQRELLVKYIELAADQTVKFWKEMNRFIKDDPGFKFNLLNKHYNLDTGFAPEVTVFTGDNARGNPKTRSGVKDEKVVINIPFRLAYKSVHTARMDDIDEGYKLNSPQTFNLIEWRKTDDASGAERNIGYGQRFTLKARTSDFYTKPSEITVRIHDEYELMDTLRDLAAFTEADGIVVTPQDNQYLITLDKPLDKSLVLATRDRKLYASVRAADGSTGFRRFFKWDTTCFLYAHKPEITACKWTKTGSDIADGAVIRIADTYTLSIDTKNMGDVSPADVTIKVFKDITGVDTEIATLAMSAITITVDHIAASLTLDKMLALDWGSDTKIYYSVKVRFGSAEIAKESNRVKVPALRFDSYYAGTTDTPTTAVSATNGAVFGKWIKCAIIIDNSIGITEGAITITMMKKKLLGSDSAISFQDGKIKIGLTGSAPPYTATCSFFFTKDLMESDSMEIYPELAIAGTGIAHKLKSNSLTITPPSIEFLRWESGKDAGSLSGKTTAFYGDYAQTNVTFKNILFQTGDKIKMMISHDGGSLLSETVDFVPSGVGFIQSGNDYDYKKSFQIPKTLYTGENKSLFGEFELLDSVLKRRFPSDRLELLEPTLENGRWDPATITLGSSEVSSKFICTYKNMRPTSGDLSCVLWRDDAGPSNTMISAFVVNSGDISIGADQITITAKFSRDTLGIATDFKGNKQYYFKIKVNGFGKVVEREYNFTAIEVKCG